MCHKGTFLIIKDNAEGKQWPNIHGNQQKPNSEPISAEGDTGCCKARADAREGTNHKLNRSPVQSLASGFFSCQPCLASSHNVWLLCRKQQRMRLKRSMLCPASNWMRQCQEKTAVPCGCQCALERLFYFLKRQQNSYKKRKDQIQHSELFLPFSFFKIKATPSLHKVNYSQNSFCFSSIYGNFTSKANQHFISSPLLNFYFWPLWYYLILSSFQDKLPVESDELDRNAKLD